MPDRRSLIERIGERVGSIDSAVRAESEAIYAALAAGLVGALLGLLLGLIGPALPLAGVGSFGLITTVASGFIAAAAAGIGYWRVRAMSGQEWRHQLSSWRFTINTTAVVLVHAMMAVIATLVAYLVLGLGFRGLEVQTFWSTVLMAVTLGLTAYIVYLSVSRMTTQRMSTLLMSLVVIGTLTAMVTSPDERWWETHFSQLGTFWDISSLVFNGTLVIAGLLVSAFAVYLSTDMQVLADSGRLERADSPRIVATMFVIMGVMLAGVGLVPVNLSLLIHNLSASGMAVMYLGLLIWSPRLLRGMPRAYFLATWAFLAATVISVVLFAVGYFSLTAFEIIVFALIFGWIAVFIRFLGAAVEPDVVATTGD